MCVVQLAAVAPDQLKETFRVTFLNAEGLDEGGVEGVTSEAKAEDAREGVGIFSPC